MDFYDLDAAKAFMVTQKALVVEDGKLLILENTADERGETSQWELPGGLLELDESLPSGLIREVREETGLEVSVGQAIAVWDFWEQGFQVRDGRMLDVRIIGIAYLCTLIGGDIQLSSEHRQYQWATLAELCQLGFAFNSRFAVEQYLLKKQSFS